MTAQVSMVRASRPGGMRPREKYIENVCGGRDESNGVIGMLFQR